MREEVLHYIWKQKLLPIQAYQTIEGDSIELLDAGQHNHHEGPDFLNAKLKIDNTLWVGHVEIHIKSSDWILHQHDQSKLYNNVILHVVYEADNDLAYLNIPTLEIKNFIPLEVVSKYDTLMRSKSPIACANQFGKISSLHKNAWWTRLLANRWQRKTEEWLARGNKSSNDWLEIVIHQLAANFGFKYNQVPFLQLIQSIPLTILLKHQSNLNQLEALLFGQSGLIPQDAAHPYIQDLEKEYHFLRRKYALTPPQDLNWRFMRLRPANFPTIRMAQLAMFYHYYLDQIPQILQFNNWEEFKKLLPIHTSPFWEKHYHFNKRSQTVKKKQLGTSALQNIIINTFAPAQYLYNHFYSLENQSHANIELLESLPKEQNHIIKKWTEIGQMVENAFESQALIECYNEYCKTKKCIECGIGHQILKDI